MLSIREKTEEEVEQVSGFILFILSIKATSILLACGMMKIQTNLNLPKNGV